MSRKTIRHASFSAFALTAPPPWLGSWIVAGGPMSRREAQGPRGIPPRRALVRQLILLGLNQCSFVRLAPRGARTTALTERRPHRPAVLPQPDSSNLPSCRAFTPTTCATRARPAQLVQHLLHHQVGDLFVRQAEDLLADLLVVLAQAGSRGAVLRRCLREAEAGAVVGGAAGLRVV